MGEEHSRGQAVHAQRADGVKKIIKNGKLVINGVEIGNIAELEFPIH